MINLIVVLLTRMSLDHIFCSNCINSYTKQQATCPVCQIPVDPSKFQSSKFVQRQIGRLRIRCPYHQSGCTWQGFYSDDHPRQVCNNYTRLKGNRSNLMTT